MTKAKAPKDLGSDGLALWKSISDKYELRVDELAMLEAACRASQRLLEMRTELGVMPLMLTGSTGQQVVNPLVAEIRAHEAQVAGLLARLKLPDEDAKSGDGRSTQARAAANSRWGKRGA